MSNLLPVNTAAGDARMHKDVAPRFNKLRKDVFAASGVDFLARCGDVLRPANFKSNKPGVAQRSWHKTGRAFDYDQVTDAIVIVGEVIGGKQYFRTYLKCVPQDGSRGQKKHVRDMRGFYVDKYLVDFTQMAEAAGFERVPAWRGWQRQYNYREFWHYQRDEGLTWDAALQQVKDRSTRPQPSVKSAVSASSKIVGLNDRDSNTGGRVTLIQNALVKAGDRNGVDIDGIYGADTYRAVRAFQKSVGLPVDGIVGPMTAAKLGISPW